MIPTKPPPTFKEENKWSEEFSDFVAKCLIKNPEERATATQLLQVGIRTLSGMLKVNLFITRSKNFPETCTRITELSFAVAFWQHDTAMLLWSDARESFFTHIRLLYRT